jgi:hypothetical protein
MIMFMLKKISRQRFTYIHGFSSLYKAHELCDRWNEEFHQQLDVAGVALALSRGFLCLHNLQQFVFPSRVRYSQPSENQGNAGELGSLVECVGWPEVVEKRRKEAFGETLVDQQIRMLVVVPQSKRHIDTTTKCLAHLATIVDELKYRHNGFSYSRLAQKKCKLP